MDPQPSTHASERARETKFLLDEGAFFDWGRDAQTLSQCSTEREMQMGLATQRVAKQEGNALIDLRAQKTYSR